MTIRTSTSEGVIVVTIDRPPVNALDLSTIIELERAVRSIAVDASVRAIVLTGAGGVFSAGVDTRAFASYSRDQRKEMVIAISRMVAALLAVPTPLVAAVNGHALGGGFVLMLACDFRAAADLDTAKLGMTEAQAGIPFPAGPIEVIKHELPPELLRRMTLASQVLSTRELLGAGVIDELCAPDQLLPMAIARAKSLAAQPGFRAVKRQVRGQLADKLSALASSGQDPFLDVFL